MGSKKSGRKLRLTKEVHETIVKHLKVGAFKSVAAAAAGISDDALAEWIKRGLKGEKAYAAFAKDVQRLVAEDCIRNQAVITAAAMRQTQGDWKAAAWNLERKYPKIYGRNLSPAVGVTVDQGGDGDELDSNTTRTRFEFYLPDNGRRPHSIGETEVDEEDEA